MRHILIYLKKDSLKNTGGPIGYNYNLAIGLNKINLNNISIDFLPGDSKISSVKSKFKHIKSKFLFSLFKGLRDLIYFLKLIFPFKHKSIVNLNNYDIVHFHSTFDMYNCRKSLKKYNGIILITTHSPILPSVEIISGYEKWIKILFFAIFINYKRIDKYCFKKCSRIISPCSHAMDSYSKYLKGYNELVKDKFEYLLTGCETKRNISKEDILNKYNINPNKTNITFLGRHSKLKGYDFIVDLSKTIDKNRVDFIIGGKLGPLYPPKSSNWKELGFINDALDVMATCDIYISANSDTYFDLAIIQAISVGDIVVAKKNGGSLFFEDHTKFPGIFLFDNYNECVKILNQIININKQDKNKLKEINKLTYMNNFTPEKFAESYVKIIDNLKG